MAPWAAPQTYLNFTGASRGPASFWTPQAYDRLRRIKAAVDPGELIRANHPVPPADDSPAGQASAGDPTAAAWPAARPATSRPPARAPPRPGGLAPPPARPRPPPACGPARQEQLSQPVTGDSTERTHGHARPRGSRRPAGHPSPGHALAPPTPAHRRRPQPRRAAHQLARALLRPGLRRGCGAARRDVPGAPEPDHAGPFRDAGHPDLVAVGPALVLR